MSGPVIGSLCTGYGGLDEGVRSVLGGDLAWVADNDPGAAAILAHRFPSVKNLGDITIADWGGAEPVDVLTAGFPCQDVSAAGKRAGLRKGNRSGVWTEVCQAIAALRPGLVVIENVRGLLTARGDEPTDEHLKAEADRDTILRLSLPQWLETERRIAVAKGDWDRARRCQVRANRIMGLRRRAVARCEWHERRLVRAIGTVLGSLADLFYDARGAVVSAADAGAPHQRERVFIVAWPAADAEDGGGRELDDGREPRAHGPEPLGWRAGVAGNDRGGRLAPADPGRDGREGGQFPSGPHEARRPGAEAGGFGPAGSGVPAQDADRPASGEWRQPAPGQAQGGRSRADAGGRGGTPPADPGRDGQPGRPAGTAGEADAPRQGPRAAAAGRGADSPADPRGAGLEVGAVEHHGPECAAAERGSRDDAAADADCQDAGPQRGGGGAAASAGPGDGTGRRCEPGPGIGGGAPADPARHGRDEGRPEPERIVGGLDAAERGHGPAADAESVGHGDAGPEGERGIPAAVVSGAFADAESTARGEPEPEHLATTSGRAAEPGECPSALAWGAYEPAIRRWEAVTGRLAPPPTEPGRTGQRLSPRFVEWMMGLPEGWVTDVPGLTRNAQLKALGNGVVPQQCALALWLLLPGWAEAAA